MKKTAIIGLLLYFLIICNNANATTTFGVQFYIDDILVNTTSEAFMRHEMNRWVIETNEFYESSEADIRIELVNIVFRDITGNGSNVFPAALMILMERFREGFVDIPQTAQTFGADYTIAVVDTMNDECGRAQGVAMDVEGLFFNNLAVMQYTCDADTLAHEIGHLMGLSHGDLVASCYGSANANGFSSYSKGYGIGNCDSIFQSGEFGTLMVGNYMARVSGGRGQVNLFSNPDIISPMCGTDQICGNLGNGNAARQLNERQHYYNSHASPNVETLDYIDPNFRDCMLQNYSGSDVKDIESINCSGRGITNIGDIERFKFARFIDLSNNNITNVDALMTLDGADEETWLTYWGLGETTEKTNKVASINLLGNDNIMCHVLDPLDEMYPNKVNRPPNCFNVGAFVAILSVLL